MTWSLENLPPQGHADLPDFVIRLRQEALDERARYNLEKRWELNHAYYRNKYWKNKGQGADKKLSINLFHSVVNRTVSNITARDPATEVKLARPKATADGRIDLKDGQIWTSRISNWWQELELSELLEISVNQMEVYGPTFEKYTWNRRKRRPEVLVRDVWSVLPDKLNRQSLQDCRYIIDREPMNADRVRVKYRLSEDEAPQPEDVAAETGAGRALHRSDLTSEANSAPTDSSFATNNRPADGGNAAAARYDGKDLTGEVMVYELWIKDPRKRTREVVVVEPLPETDALGNPVIDPMLGEPRMIEVETKHRITEDFYPGQIRCIVFCRNARDEVKILADVPNPSINRKLDPDAAKFSWLFDNFPFSLANSYRDTSCLIGFSCAEQIADLVQELNQMFSRIAENIKRMMNPALILPLDCGVPESTINNQPGLLIRPKRGANSQFIRYLSPQSLSQDIFRFYEMVRLAIDLLSGIEDADRGRMPSSVVSAAAIVALQERGAVLVRQKIRSVDRLVRNRGRAAISLFQNFGTAEELIEVNGRVVEFRGSVYLGQQYIFTVESGSTMAKTSLGVAEDAKWLFSQRAIDAEALLDALGFPNAKAIVERMAEGRPLQMALNILRQAGIQPPALKQIFELATQPQYQEQAAEPPTPSPGPPVQPAAGPPGISPDGMTEMEVAA